MFKSVTVNSYFGIVNGTKCDGTLVSFKDMTDEEHTNALEFVEKAFGSESGPMSELSSIVVTGGNI